MLKIQLFSKIISGIYLEKQTMEDFLQTALNEETRLENLINEMEKVFQDDKKIQQEISKEISTLRQEKLDTEDFLEKNKIEEKINELYKKSSLYLFQDPKILRKPYFGVLELDDDKLGRLPYKIGKKTIFGKDGKVSVIDWREAPISRLFYEYDAGENYDEDIRDLERSGKVAVKRSLEITNRELKNIRDGDILLTKEKDGKWSKAVEKNTSSKRKEEKKDHSLPEITSLISREQFQAITFAPEKTFILQGGAGSGKTTVGLHRIAYLTYNSPQKFNPSEIVIIIFNKSLQKYIKGVLPELGIAGGVKTLTYHRFASLIFSRAKINPGYGQNNPVCAPIKKSSFAIKLIQSYTEILFEKSYSWLNKKFTELEFKKGRRAISKASDLSDLINIIKNRNIFNRETTPEQALDLVVKLSARLGNHRLDLLKLFSDKDFILSIAKKENLEIEDYKVDALIKNQKNLHERKSIDFSDIGILVYLMQLKGVDAALPKYSHIMVDEAQDLSPVEIVTILKAADEKNSVTICGDMAQKIKSDVYFDNKKGFSGFIRTLAGINNARLGAEKLEIGYRATKEIMDISWHVMKNKKEIKTARSGDPVVITRTSSFDETMFRAGAVLSSFHEQRPNSLTCVICKYKKEADLVFETLRENSSIKNIRRHERDDFIFTPGIVVTNVHQVKGLEFSGVMFINPSKKLFSNTDEDRMLLHVAFTRASEKLWIFGQDEMAYGIEEYGEKISKNII